MAPFVALMSAIVYLIDKKAGIFTSICVALYVLAAGAIYVYHKKYIQADLVHYAAGYGKVQKQLLKEMVVPYGVLDMEGKLLWGNDEMIDFIKNYTEEDYASEFGEKYKKWNTSELPPLSSQKAPRHMQQIPPIRHLP